VVGPLTPQDGIEDNLVHWKLDMGRWTLELEIEPWISSSRRLSKRLCRRSVVC